MSRYHAALIYSLLFAFTAAATSVYGREWTDANNKSLGNAELLTIRGEKVQLKTESGKEIIVPISALSRVDQEYVRSLMDLSSSAITILKEHCHSCHGHDGRPVITLVFASHHPARW